MNTGFLQHSHAPSAPSSSGALKDDGTLQVLPTFQLTTNPRVFAAGDVVDIPEQKTLMKASMYHTPVIVANILQLLSATKKSDRLKTYGNPTNSILITNGRVRPLLFFVLSFTNRAIVQRFILFRFLHLL